jgi:hypothetical protein
MNSYNTGLSRYFPLLAIVVCLVAGWYVFLRGDSSPSIQAANPGVLGGESSAAPLLLQPSQIGDRYSQQTQGSFPTTGEQIRSGQSASGRKVIAAAWKAGARSTYAEQYYGPTGVITRAELFTTSALAPVAAGIRAQLVKRYHAHLVRAPSGAPGAHGWLLRGTAVSPMISSQFGPERVVAVYGWQHGSVLATIIVSSLAKNDVESMAITLAKAQDENIGFASR